jgi:thioredoxin 2
MTTNNDSYTITCPACGTGNRIPASREGQTGRCGSCHASLPPLYLHPLPLNDQSFSEFITKYPGPVVAEFWASW